MRQESYEKWYPLEAVPQYLPSTSLIAGKDGTLVIVCHNTVDKVDILLKFNSFYAYQVHGEFVHPWMDHQSLHPKSENSNHTFPFLKVNESIWLSSVSEVRLVGMMDNPLHLQIITLNYCTDILCHDYPTASLVNQEAVEHLYNSLTIFETLPNS